MPGSRRRRRTPILVNARHEVDVSRNAQQMMRRVTRSAEQITHAEDGWVSVGDGARLGGGIPASQMPVEAEIVESIAMIVMGNKKYGTGCLVRVKRGRGEVIPCLFTCAHCISRERGVKVIFNHDARGLRYVETRTNPETFYMTASDTPDVCVCALDPFDGMEDRRAMRVGTSQACRGDVLVIQHPNAARTTVSRGHGEMLDRDTILHDANTLPGSSGAPIVRVRNDGTLRLCGVHCEAVDVRMDARTTAKMNLGYTVRAIAAALRSKRCTFA